MNKDIGWSGFKIKGLRLANNISPKDLAEVLEITPTYLSLVENGKRTPSPKVTKKAALHFSISEKEITELPDFIFDIEEKVNLYSKEDKISSLHYMLKRIEINLD
jgi:transcriptional regulator with XRE-family HTH domain